MTPNPSCGPADPDKSSLPSNLGIKLSLDHKTPSMSAVCVVQDCGCHLSSHTSARSWPMYWLGVMFQPLNFSEVTTIRFHHRSGTV
jgi:hypothetical protein